MNEYLEAFCIILVILTYPIPFLIIIRLIRGWNEIHYVRDLFSNNYYMIDPDKQLGPTVFAPIVSHIILFDEIICFIYRCVRRFLKKPVEMLTQVCEIIGDIRLK